jgi:hypothetical protein
MFFSINIMPFMEKFMSLHGKVYVPSWKSLCPFMEKFMSLHGKVYVLKTSKPA